jgi:hypothetical protein
MGHNAQITHNQPTIAQKGPQIYDSLERTMVQKTESQFMFLLTVSNRATSHIANSFEDHLSSLSGCMGDSRVINKKRIVIKHQKCLILKKSTLSGEKWTLK